eukprot:CAMPEP_0118711224 /NCGR_PEP_ID=MMETSP0800-20121206/23944_1 /TAXON_ID=210618 ORGANISM="Striatella unipunctata, Strain CCMP2910" /NCGR_SAMPLE_ID=MMETSP0800 /ASSEMBLY_ACC=CAM_ASM_000638 /LENGTH=90 /DNA_ID=CAMNT_0006615745 /DNA_START=17 /DNA_END=286 /DNA_ORIENTATION=+
MHHLVNTGRRRISLREERKGYSEKLRMLYSSSNSSLDDSLIADMKKIENRVHFVREESLIAKSPRGMKGDFEEEEEEEEEEECNFRYQPR